MDLNPFIGEFVVRFIKLTIYEEMCLKYNKYDIHEWCKFVNSDKSNVKYPEKKVTNRQIKYNNNDMAFPLYFHLLERDLTYYFAFWCNIKLCKFIYFFIVGFCILTKARIIVHAKYIDTIPIVECSL